MSARVSRPLLICSAVGRLPAETGEPLRDMAASTRVAAGPVPITLLSRATAMPAAARARLIG
jgi:hypothetical protein